MVHNGIEYGDMQVRISASRRVEAPSRHRRDSCPSHNEVGGFFFDFEAVRTASSDRDAPRRYKRLRAAAAPYAYDDYKKQKVAKKLAEKQESRIRRAEALPSVNAELAQRLLSPPEEDKPRKRGKKKSKQGLPSPTEANPLGDDRFGAMFTDERFQVDESTEEWKLRHPPVKSKK